MITQSGKPWDPAAPAYVTSPAAKPTRAYRSRCARAAGRTIGQHSGAARVLEYRLARDKGIPAPVVLEARFCYPLPFGDSPSKPPSASRGWPAAGTQPSRQPAGLSRHILAAARLRYSTTPKPRLSCRPQPPKRPTLAALSEGGSEGQNITRKEAKHGNKKHQHHQQPGQRRGTLAKGR